MKIYSDYEKKLNAFYAVERNHNRGYKVYFFLSFLGFCFLIYSIINLISKTEYEMRDYIFLAIGISALILFFIAGFIRLYIIKFLPKKKPLFTEILNTYVKGELVSEVSNYGIEPYKLDAIIHPSGYINIAYIYDKNCIVEATVEKNDFLIKTNVTKEVTSYVEVKIFNKHLKKQYGRIHKFNSRGYNKEQFYKEFKDFIDKSDIKELSLKCQEAIEEHKKTYR